MKLHLRYPAAVQRIQILIFLAGVFGFLLLWQLWSLFPQAIARISVTVLCALAVMFVSWRLFRSRRIGLRTLVLMVPICVAAICYPGRYVIENRQITSRLERAGVSDYLLETNGRLVESFGSFLGLLIDYRVSSLFKTKLRYLYLDLCNVQEDALTYIPTDHLLRVRVTLSQKQKLTKHVIAWLNDLPDDCDIDLGLFGLVDEDTRLLDQLEHDVYSVYVNDQVLSEKSLTTILNLAPNELSFRGIGFVANNSFVGATAINVELLRISKCSLSESEIAGLLKTTNPKTLLLLMDLAPVTPQEFGLVFSLQRLEGLSTQVSWLTIQHLASLGRSESLQWASIQYCGIPEDQFERLRTASPTVRINGKLGRPD